MKKQNSFDFSMFAVRLIIGSIFTIYGAQKLFGMFGGVGIESTSKIVEALGVPNPYIFAIIWAGVEFIGGIFLVLGIFARWAAFCIVIMICVNFFGISLNYGFYGVNTNVEYSLLVIASCIPLVLLGGGRWSVWDF
ncbi:MAG: DoxX family protein [Candidatus Omnitrophota bacterium]|nr:DoxX family protein [Candidatus Omnitrophota bacterium]MBU1895214.1 DoxX family protein [Candidatus Omnitrophota bacterium]